MTPLKNITQLTVIYQDLHIQCVEAYDNVKKCYCILEIPMTQTTWTHSITY